MITVSTGITEYYNADDTRDFAMAEVETHADNQKKERKIMAEGKTRT